MVDVCERRGLGTGFGGMYLTNSPAGNIPSSFVRRFLPFSQPVNCYMCNSEQKQWQKEYTIFTRNSQRKHHNSVQLLSLCWVVLLTADTHLKNNTQPHHTQ